MKLRSKSAAAGVLALALAGAGLAAVAAPASAYTGNPPWAAGDTFRKGAVTLFDASGNQLTGGANINAISAYLGTSGTAPRTNATKATANVAAPDPAVSVPSTWATALMQGNYTFSPVPAGTPASVQGAFLKLTASGAGLQDAASGVVLYSGANASYLNVLEIRIQDSGTGVATDGGKYWATDIEYNPTTAGSSYDGLAPGEWRVLYPAVSGTATTTSVVANPSSGSSITSFTFDATVSANSGGSVAFSVDGAAAFSTKPVSGAGTVTSAATVLTAGPHTVTATFTPSAAPQYQAGYAGSSGQTSVTVTQNVDTTTTNVSVDSTPVAQPGSVTGTAVVTNDRDSSAVTSGSVAFYRDGGTLIGTDSNGTDGWKFSLSTGTDAGFVGSHTVYAVYSGATGLGGSQSSTAAFDVTAAQFTPDVQSVATVINPGTITISTPYSGDTGYCAVVTNPASADKGKLVLTAAGAAATTAVDAAGDLLPATSGATNGQQDSHLCGYLFLPAMTLNSSATQYSTSGTFDNIVVTDTRPGDNSYDLSAKASDLVNAAGTGANYTIASTNVGFGGLAADAIHSTDSTFGLTGTGTYNFTTFNRPATPGIGGAGAQILHANVGLGDVTMHGTLTVQAPTTTRDGVYTGQVTFSVVG